MAFNSRCGVQIMIVLRHRQLFMDQPLLQVSFLKSVTALSFLCADVRSTSVLLVRSGVRVAVLHGAQGARGADGTQAWDWRAVATLQLKHRSADAAWSPYVPGEVAVTTEEGSVLLADAGDAITAASLCPWERRGGLGPQNLVREISVSGLDRASPC